MWSRFRQFRRNLAYRPVEVDRIYRLFDYASMGLLDMGPSIGSTLEIGLSWDSTQAGWIGPGLPQQRMMVLFSTSVMPFGKLGRIQWPPIYARERGIGVSFVSIEVNHNSHGSTAPDHMNWDKGSIIQPRASSLRVIVDHASLPGSPGFLDSSWCSLSHSLITQEDVAVWPCSVNILVEFTSFFATLHWAPGAADLGKYGISFLELPVMFEVNAGHGLDGEKVIRFHLRARRPLVGSSSLASIGNEIRRGCHFIHGLFRALNHLGLSLVNPVHIWSGSSVAMAFLRGLGKAVTRRSSIHFCFFWYSNRAATELCNGT